MKIPIGVDGSSQGLAGARWVATLPLSSTDEVVVVSVLDRPVMIGAQAEADRTTEEAASELTGLPCTVRTLVRDGHPVATLPRIISELAADLVVVGPHGRGRLDSILLGSVSQSLLHSMPTSILVAREPVRAPERVLLAFDGSPHSLAAARFLAHFPLPPGARIDVLTSAGALSDGYTAYGAADLRDLVALVGRHAAKVIRQAVEVLSAVGRAAKPVLRHGDPKREILAAAGELESDLIVMGARGFGGFRGLILGSVSRAVRKAAPCSTLVVAHRAGASA